MYRHPYLIIYKLLNRSFFHIKVGHEPYIHVNNYEDETYNLCVYTVNKELRSQCLSNHVHLISERFDSCNVLVTVRG